eukprot:5789287-Alexandrium_andersonii.AAC.2
MTPRGRQYQAHGPAQPRSAKGPYPRPRPHLHPDRHDEDAPQSAQQTSKQTARRRKASCPASSKRFPGRAQLPGRRPGSGKRPSPLRLLKLATNFFHLRRP